ncbi:MAG: hypothetical protein LIO92_01665 [Clostridiales bacterium]|nr:hypothetical protein [Clostridiales bacterium]
MENTNKNQNELDFYEGEYMPQMNRVGKVTGFLGVAASFCPAIALAVVYGLLPQPAALLAAFVAGAASFGVLWFVEPISYFPVLGTVGTYMAFLSGNISNMRVPCASVAQAAARVEPGSPKASVIATLGMAVSIVINLSVLTIGVILGSSALAMLPPVVTEALSYLLPSLFGALLVQFAMKKVKLGVIVLAFGILIYIGINGGVFAWLPGAANYLPVLGCIFFSIAVGMLMMGKN